ncbi:type VI secretion system baseplate subunit TssG [Thalassococcus sp. S3]|uniref:type VI secretion system baseplate subunit TssG n=1 Tax=Thalassococcus sp. S3 TaxID=2017482 RepID=UPI0010244E12|nr:type VI secretion system baseplate subunit TssG [Thalassococcus sp. S3]QBF33988.1 hypothetical protein CFI11_22670 [Thalassococcus sp. S3]
MARDDWPAGDTLAAWQTMIAKASARPEAFDLFQMLRKIDALRPDLPRLGEGTRPAQDCVRLGQEPSLAFAPRPIADVAQTDPDAPARIQAFGFGLFGPNGPLPQHLSEYAFGRLHNARDSSFVAFADMFHHRLMTFFFRAWAEAEPVVSHDRPDEDRFGRQAASLAGYGMESLERRDEMPDLLKWHFIGRLSDQSRNPEGLAAIIGTFFTAPVRIVEFVPSWVDLPRSSRCRLGSVPPRGDAAPPMMLGQRVRTYHHRFEMVIGPLSLANYERFLPSGPSMPALSAIVSNYVGEALDWVLTLVLHRDQVPAVHLGKAGRLGWTGWLGQRRSPDHARDLTRVGTRGHVRTQMQGDAL